MAKNSQHWVVLLRGIGPSTYKKMSMQQLRDGCIDAGLADVRTYIASGNLLFNSPLPKTRIKTLIESILLEYALDNAVIVRSVPEMKALLKASPMKAAAKKRPNLMLTVFFNKKIDAKSADELIARKYPERILVRNNELCIDYVDGVARSKLTPALIDRIIGQPGTARNWNTIGKLIELSES